jgi:endothelin-converting enzyme/putative endopeptidase
LSQRPARDIIQAGYLLVHRKIVLATALLLALDACHERVPARPAGDEQPYPPLDQAAMDRTAAPCQDFYQYACGRWATESPTPADRSQWVRGAGELEERDARLLRRILEEARAGKVESQDRFLRKAGDFYAACLEEADVEARAPAELQAEWSRLDAAESREALGEELARLEAMGLPVPFALRAEVDPQDPRRAVLALRAAGVGPLGPAPEASPDGGAADAGTAYAGHVRAELRLAGLPAAQLDGAVEGALALERALAAARAPAPLDPPRRLDRAGLERLAPGFPWGGLLGAVGAGRRAALTVDDPGFAVAAARLFQEAPLDQWRAYLRWRLADHLTAARATTAAMAEERFRFQAALGPAPAEPRPRWKHCAELTGRIFGFAAGTAFGRRHLGAGGREAAASLVSQVEAGLRAALDAVPWMDTATEVRAAHKLERLQLQVGFPDAGPDYDRLRVGRGTYLRNVLSAGRFAVAAEVARAERPVDRAEWVLSPMATAPAYLAEQNALVVPAGALQPPVYDREAPLAVRFGAMGTQVGRALAEALQGTGRWRGAEGERAAWWTVEAGQRFAAAQACIAGQFQAWRAAPVPGEPPAEADPGPGAEAAAGDLAAANLAELAGLRSAFGALRAAQSRETAGPRLLGFSPDQQFFLAYAQTLCSARPAGAAADDPAARFRVNGPLSNFPPFAQAFRCGEGTPMARASAERCRAW